MAKILITLPDEFLNKVNGFVDTQNCSRSEVIRVALKNYMRKISAQGFKNASKHAEILDEILK